MKVAKQYTLSYNPLRGVVILTRKGSSYDLKYFHNYDWMFPVYDGTLRQVVDMLKSWENYTLIKQR